MTDTRQVFDALSEELARSKRAEKALMFGKPCMKYRGNGFMAFFDGDLVLKLSGHVEPSIFQVSEFERRFPMKIVLAIALGIAMAVPVFAQTAAPAPTTSTTTAAPAVKAWGLTVGTK